MIHKWMVLAFLLSVSCMVAAANPRPLQIDDLFKIQRVSEPDLSPDGKWVVFTLTTSDVEANKNTTDLWLASIDGTEVRRLTSNTANDRRGVWSPDGKWIAFESTRSGSSQIWLINPQGGEATQFTGIATEASSPVWSPDSRMIAYLSSVYPEFSSKPYGESNELNRKKDEEKEKNPVKARVYTRLFVRHWDTWADGKRQHIFVQPVGGGDPKDITPGDRDAVPNSGTFSAGVDFAFSPDSKQVAYTAAPTEKEAWNTNYDVYAVSVNDGLAVQITANPAADGYPQYSPDGKYIAYRAQSAPGYEADRWQLQLYDRATEKSRSITADFDESVGTPVWSPDSKSLYFESEDQGRVPLFQATVAGVVTKVFDRHSNSAVSISRDGKTLVFLEESLSRPSEVYRFGLSDQKAIQVTKTNDEMFAGLDIPAAESITYAGEGGTTVQAWLMKPPGFKAEQKYPLIYMVHGGPQSAWHDSWHYRWNLAMWAAQGYVVMAPNPRGSTGFGEKFTQEISKDWDGKVFVDLVKGLEYAEALPYVNRERMAAAGASFGGYMMHWFEGHLPGKFRTIVCHDGTFDARSQGASTEEQWFENYEHGGTPWDNPEHYDRVSPDRSAAKFSTPMLIIHGELDFRIPYTQALEAFTALQYKGIPSKLVLFPNENHWVLKPGNSKFWHQTVFDWLASYLK
jgi:dipeptidyl aminopeptidase/acylaminoacyl peptidase